MYQVSRANHLKIPKKIELVTVKANCIEDVLATKKGLALARGEKWEAQKRKEEVIEEDKENKVIDQIPFNANDLMVITVTKKLTAYVIAITEKSPKKFRGVFVNRMQNYCLDTMECLLKANFIRMDSPMNKSKREQYQKEAIVKLKLLGYMALVAENANCILKKQYQQISMQLSEAINLIVVGKRVTIQDGK